MRSNHIVSLPKHIVSLSKHIVSLSKHIVLLSKLLGMNFAVNLSVIFQKSEVLGSNLDHNGLTFSFSEPGMLCLEHAH